MMLQLQQIWHHFHLCGWLTLLLLQVIQSSMLYLLRSILLVSLLLLIAACSAAPGGPGRSTTTVTVSIVAPAVGALPAAGVPTGVKSFQVEALRGGVVVRSVSATLPTTVVQLTLRNGVYSFRLTAFDVNGVALYQGLSSVYALTGVDLPIPISMTGAIAVTADHTIVNAGDPIHLKALFMNAQPTAANPLIWSATGGVVSLDAGAVNGDTATWIAPQQGGTFTVTAKVDPAVNAQQGANGSGDTTVKVVDLPPLVVPSSLRYGVVGVPTLGISPQLNATGWALIQNWVTATQVIDDIDGVKVLAAPALAASYPIGDTSFSWSSRDSGGNTTTVQSLLHIYVPSSPTTLKVVDVAGAPISKVRVGSLALSSYTVAPVLNSALSSQTDAAGQLVASLLDPAESYLLSFGAVDGYADGFWSTGGVVSTYQSLLAWSSQQQSTTVTVSMHGGAGRVAGQVLDGNGAAIAYARVDLAPAPYSDLGSHLVAVADSSGNFSVSALPNDYYVIASGGVIDPRIGVEHALSSKLAGGFYTANRAAVSPYQSAAALVRVSVGTVQAVYMQLIAGGVVAGRVTTPSGVAVANMRVNLEPYGVTGAYIYETTTDINGIYQLNVAAADYLIAATNRRFDPFATVDAVVANGYVGGYVRDGNAQLSLLPGDALIHPVAQGGVRVVNLVLQQGGAIQGRVTGGAWVRLFAQDIYSGAVQVGFADGAGDYTINMMPGTVRLVVDSYSIDRVSGQLVATPGGVVGGYVDGAGVAQSVKANAKSLVVPANGVVLQSIQLNTGVPFDASAVVGSFIP
ncbi:MAG: hypothetical protein Q9M13_06945 [Mariprofundales bacterium]|nr:hypothetical protein [Mariprofundales bacterium]